MERKCYHFIPNDLDIYPSLLLLHSELALPFIMIFYDRLISCDDYVSLYLG